MERRKIRLTLMVFLTLGSFACKQDDLPFFTGEKVLVMRTGSEPFKISNHYPLDQEYLMFEVHLWLLGADGTEAPIPYTLRLNGDVTEMEHELSPQKIQTFHSTYVVAGKPDTLRFLFTREEAWTDTVYNLGIALETDSRYRPPLKSTEFTTQGRLLVDDRLGRPDWWDAAFVDYFGPFSSRKMRTLFFALFSVEGIVPHDVYEQMGEILRDDLPGYSARFRQYLAQRDAAGNPALERDGKPVSAGLKADER